MFPWQQFRCNHRSCPSSPPPRLSRLALPVPSGGFAGRAQPGEPVLLPIAVRPHEQPSRGPQGELSPEGLAPPSSTTVPYRNRDSCISRTQRVHQGCISWIRTASFANETVTASFHDHLATGGQDQGHKRLSWNEQFQGELNCWYSPLFPGACPLALRNAQLEQGKGTTTVRLGLE